MNPATDLKVRPYQPADEAFVKSSWKEGLETGSWAPRFEKFELYGLANAIFDHWPTLGVFDIRVAVFPDEPNVIVGWAAVYHWRTQHKTSCAWASVKYKFRGMGIGKHLRMQWPNVELIPMSLFEVLIQEHKYERILHK